MSTLCVAFGIGQVVRAWPELCRSDQEPLGRDSAALISLFIRTDERA